jgi:plastocyanin
MSRTLTLLAALVAALALLAACTPGEPEFSGEDRARAAERGADEDTDNGEPADNGEPGDTLTVVAHDIYYEEESYSTSAGAVGIELINEGRIFHDVAVEELGDQVVVEANPGETNTGTVNLEAGTYTLFCTVPGHRAAGMEATLEVN